VFLEHKVPRALWERDREQVFLEHKGRSCWHAAS
jgi:hypothetical protein